MRSAPWWIPWTVIGALVVIGGLAALIYGSPFAPKNDLDQLSQSVKSLADTVSRDHDAIGTLSTNEAVTSTNLANAAGVLAHVQQQQDAIDTRVMGLEADEKARDAQDVLRHGR